MIRQIREYVQLRLLETEGPLFTLSGLIEGGVGIYYLALLMGRLVFTIKSHGKGEWHAAMAFL